MRAYFTVKTIAKRAPFVPRKMLSMGRHSIFSLFVQPDPTVALAASAGDITQL
jgi:hypothetical protein